MPKRLRSFFLVLLLFVGIIFVSEAIYNLRIHSDIISGYYLKKVDINTSKPPSRLENRLLVKALYHYLNRSSVVSSSKNGCLPFCIDYGMGQKVVELFKYAEKTEEFENLEVSKRAQLFFWVSTINIRHNDDQITLDWLRQASSLEPSNKQYGLFHRDLEKITQIQTDLAAQNYFMDKLNSENSLQLYEQLYFAKASFSLAEINFLNTNNSGAKVYVEKAIALNPWNIDYYLFASKIYQSEANPEKAIEILERCTQRIPQDSSDCSLELQRLRPL